MAKDLVGIDLPEDVQGPGITQLVNDSIGAILNIATWEDFLRTASKKQIATVMDCLAYCAQPDAHMVHIQIPQGPHSII